jgi:hypothetical protein
MSCGEDEQVALFAKTLGVLLQFGTPDKSVKIDIPRLRPFEIAVKRHQIPNDKLSHPFVLLETGCDS